jgi:hypothetical protein
MISFRISVDGDEDRVVRIEAPDSGLLYPPFTGPYVASGELVKGSEYDPVSSDPNAACEADPPGWERHDRVRGRRVVFNLG